MRPLARVWSSLALKLVPREWRDTVAQDLDDEALRSGRSGWWIGCQAIAAGVRLRPVVNGDVMWTDLRYAVRSLMQARWFTIGAVLTFALGIGVNVAVFSAVDRISIRPLPYAAPDRLVVLGEFPAGKSRAYGTIPGLIASEVARLDVVEDIMAAGWNANVFSIAAEPDTNDRIQMWIAPWTVGRVLGLRPVIGRNFTEDDVRAKRAVALIGFRTWVRRFDKQADVIGQTLWSSAKRTEIIGVLPEGFIPPASLLDPTTDGMVLDVDDTGVVGQGRSTVRPIVRLRESASIEQFQRSVAAIGAAYRQAQPQPAGQAAVETRAEPLRQFLFGKFDGQVRLVIGAASLVLLIACANLASLMLVRGRARERQAAIAIALGASRVRVLRGALIEAACLAGAGGVIAALALTWTHGALERLLPPVFSQFSSSVSDPRVLWAVVTLATLSSLLAGMWPALRASRVNPMTALQQQTGRGHTGAWRGHSLLIVEAAVSVVLVAGAVATTRSLLVVGRNPLGFSPDGLYQTTIRLQPTADRAAGAERDRAVLELLRTLPGIESVAAADSLPLMPGVLNARLAKEFPDGQRYHVTGDFFSTLKTPLLAGRSIDAADVRAEAKVGVLSEAGLRLVWPGVTPRDAVGRVFTPSGEPAIQIVGVVADVRPIPTDTPWPSLYVPVPKVPFRLDFVVRTADGQPPSISTIRSRLKSVGLVPVTIRTVSQNERIDSSLLNSRFRSALFGLFGLAALLLAMIGLYAVSSAEVEQGRREMGVRLSLGATPGRIVRSVLLRALRPVGGGVAIGLLVSYWASQFLQTFLVLVDARDGWTLAGVATVLIGTAVVAAWIPARRAARTDPAVVLRAD